MANFKVGDRVRIKNPNKQIGQDDGTYEVTLIRPDGMVSIKAPSEKVGFAVRPEQLIANAARNAKWVILYRDGGKEKIDAPTYDAAKKMADERSRKSGRGYVSVIVDDGVDYGVNAVRSRNDAIGRYKPGARVDVELRTRPIVGKVMQYGGRPEVEYSPTMRTRFTGTLIKQNGNKWDIKSDSGEVYKSVSEADFGLSYNSLCSRNAVVQKALNAMARNIRAIPVDSKGKGIIERCKIRTADGEVAEVSHIDEDGFVYFKAKDGRIRGVPADTVVRLNTDTSVVRAKALNAAACNAKFRVFLDNGRETEIVATSESSASDKVLQKFKFWGDKAPKVSRVVRLKPVVSGRFVGKANGLEYYVDYTDDLGFAKKYGKDGTNVTEIHINTPYLKDEDGRERRHIVYTWSRGSEWIGDKFKHPDFPDAARAARDLAAKLIRSNPNVAKIGDDTNDWR